MSRNPTSQPPPRWRRLLRFPRTLGRKLRRAARHRWHALGRRIRGPGVRGIRGTAIQRAWARTDPDYFARWATKFRGIVPRPEPVPAPGTGTEVTLSGQLRAENVAWGTLQLDALALDVAALELDPGMPGFLAQRRRSRGFR